MTKSNHNFVAIIGAIVICYCYAMTQMKHGKEGLFTLKPRRLDGIGGVGMDGIYYCSVYTTSFPIPIVLFRASIVNIYYTKG